MESLEKSLREAQDELKSIALYLCDENEEEANMLLYRTNEIATKCKSNEDLKELLIKIMKFTFLDEVKKKIQVRTTT